MKFSRQSLFVLVLLTIVFISGCIELFCKKEWVRAFDAPAFTDENCESMCYDMYKAKEYKIERSAVKGTGNIYLDRCYCYAAQC